MNPAEFPQDFPARKRFFFFTDELLQVCHREDNKFGGADLREV